MEQVKLSKSVKKKVARYLTNKLYKNFMNTKKWVDRIKKLVDLLKKEFNVNVNYCVIYGYLRSKTVNFVNWSCDMKFNWSNKYKAFRFQAYQRCNKGYDIFIELTDNDIMKIYQAISTSK